MLFLLERTFRALIDYIQLVSGSFYRTHVLLFSCLSPYHCAIGLSLYLELDVNTPEFLLLTQVIVLRILGIFLLAFLYGSFTLYTRAFQPTSSWQVRKYPSPTTPHPYCISTAVRFALFRFHSPSNNGISIDFFSLGY